MDAQIPAGTRPWAYDNDASAAITNGEGLAASKGKAFLTHLFFNTVPGGTIVVLNGTGGTVKFGTVTIAANGTMPPLDRSANPLEIGGNGVFITTTGEGVQCVSAAGYYYPNPMT